MELIVKPTGRCNFACSFCMSGKMASNIKHFEHVPPELKKTIDVLKPSLIIFNGGDPLLSGPQYFEEILEYCDSNIGIVTNLKDFWINPRRWEKLFNNNRVSVTTSFQYGPGRKWSDSEVYSEEMFIKVGNKFKEVVGYFPYFISVISEDNEDRAIDHVLLAKRLGTECKLNGMLALGLADNTYPKYKMIDIWLKIKELGLEKYASNYIQFYKGGCSFNTCMMCNSTIRVFWIDNENKVHYSNCDNCSTLGAQIPFDEVAPEPIPSKLDPKLFINGAKCFSCKLCRFCNACNATREANRNVPNYCEEMKKRIPKIIEAGWYL